MRKINIIYTGEIKASERYFTDAIAEYKKRLSGEFKITETETDKILSKINPKSFKIALCIEGKRLSSEDFAKLIYQHSPADFFIGGSDGLADEVKKSADYLLSLSDMTFTHRMARVMLMEQIYRAYTLETGRKYHK